MARDFPSLDFNSWFGFSRQPVTRDIPITDRADPKPLVLSGTPQAWTIVLGENHITVVHCEDDGTYADWYNVSIRGELVSWSARFSTRKKVVGYIFEYWGVGVHTPGFLTAFLDDFSK